MLSTYIIKNTSGELNYPVGDRIKKVACYLEMYFYTYFGSIYLYLLLIVQISASMKIL